jgi:hypothetical protein
MPSPKVAMHPRESAYYIPYNPSTYVLTIKASVHGHWASVLYFKESDKAINIESMEGIGSKNP